MQKDKKYSLTNNVQTKGEEDKLIKNIIINNQVVFVHT